MLLVFYTQVHVLNLTLEHKAVAVVKVSKFQNINFNFISFNGKCFEYGLSTMFLSFHFIRAVHMGVNMVRPYL